jgi:hypothetical protein
MSESLRYALEPIGVLVVWFLIGLWVWRNDD